MAKTKIELQPYFGKWGGFFVPDPMTPALDELTNTANDLINDPFFAEKVCNMVHVPTDDFEPSEADHVFSVKSFARKYIAAGYALIAKETGKEIVAGAVNQEEAAIIVDACKEAGVSLSIWLNVQTGSDEAFVKSLTNNGVSVNLDQCRELFDDPEMYSFQKYIANPMKHQWMPLHSHCGPAPFPALTMYFSSLAAQKVISAAESKFTGKKLNIAAPAFSGLSMIGMLAAKSDDTALLSYGPKADAEREECYLGAYTKVNGIGTTEFTLSPVLINAWESNTVGKVDTVAPLIEFAKKNTNEVYLVVEE